MKKISSIIGGTIILCIFVAGFIAYFTTSFNPDTHVWLDGFGRPLSESPWFMRYIFGQERLWPGWGWFFGDMVIFWGGMGLGVALVNYGNKK